MRVIGCLAQNKLSTAFTCPKASARVTAIISQTGGFAMDVKRWLHVAVIGASAALATSTDALAQGVPAELPPESFSGVQYIDSAGCAFVRAGVAGVTEWIPRVGRDRRQICGQTPTFAGGVTAAAPTAPARDPDVVIIGGAPAPAAPATVQAPAAPASTPRAQPAPRTVVRIVPAPAPAPAATVQAAPAAPASCPGMTGIAAQIMSGPDVRCGPQPIHPGDAARGIDRPGPSMGDQSRLALPPVPEGYRPAFDDGRLNPLRGPRSAAGNAQMARVWTDTLPRRLVEVEATQSTVTASSRSVAPRSRAAAPNVAAPDVAEAAPVIRVAADHRNILAGTYSTRAEADQAYARLSATGLPVRLGQVDRQSGTIYAVVAGPFGSSDALVRAVQQTHAAGFSQATTRR